MNTIASFDFQKLYLNLANKFLKNKIIIFGLENKILTIFFFNYLKEPFYKFKQLPFA